MATKINPMDLIFGYTLGCVYKKDDMPLELPKNDLLLFKMEKY